MRTIGVVSVGRSDFGLYTPILRRITSTPGLALHLMVSGAHLLPEFGLTVKEIEAAGFPVGDRIEMLLPSDTPQAIGESIGCGVIGFARAFARTRPDILLALGDRFEMLAAVVAALPHTIPIAHIHGGEVTEGAVDEGIRHAITKLSHLHFVSTAGHRDRVVRMGEEPWRVTVSGAPGLDNVRTQPLLGPDELSVRYGIDCREPYLLVTYHPVTLELDQLHGQIAALLEALGKAAMPVLITYPNADAGGRTIIGAIEAFAAQTPRVTVVPNFGMQVYLSAMKRAAAVVGNSSSGIIEAGSFEVPVVNIGIRQQRRTRGPNVIDVRCAAPNILAAIRRAVSPEFRANLRGMVNPYGDGHAAERIVDRLASEPVGQRLLVKRFHDA